MTALRQRAAASWSLPALACGAGFALCIGTLGCGTNAVPAQATRPKVSVAQVDSVVPAECKGAWTVAATGQVVGADGVGIEGAQVNYCVYANGLGSCLAPVQTGLGGWYTYNLAADFRCLDKLTTRVLVPVERNQRRSEMYCKETLNPVRGALDLPSPHRLDTLAAPVRAPASRDPKVLQTFGFEGGLEVSFKPDDTTEGADADKLSAGRIDLNKRPCFLPPGLELDALYAFSPNMNVQVFADRPNIGFALPNPQGYLEGTEVELYLLGGLGTQLSKAQAVEEGDFVRAGTGIVAGGRIVPKPGSELPALTYVGYRRLAR